MDDWRIQRFSNPNDARRLNFGEQPPSSGWASGPNGLFRDGVKIADQIDVQIGRVDVRAPYLEIKYIPIQPD